MATMRNLPPRNFPLSSPLIPQKKRWQWQRPTIYRASRSGGAASRARFSRSASASKRSRAGSTRSSTGASGHYRDPVTNEGQSVTGVDACAGGWVAVTLAFPASDASAHLVTAGIQMAPTLDELSLTGVVGVDMPLGLLTDGWRDADVLARRALGRRGVTVFAIPPRPVWQQPTHADANRGCRELTGKGLSAQTWGRRGKLLEADEYRRKSPALLYEVHPELAFAALAGAPLQESKHTPAGLTARRQLLAGAGFTLPPKGPGAAGNAPPDPAAVAWSARRIAAGEAVTLTNPAQPADDDTEIAI